MKGGAIVIKIDPFLLAKELFSNNIWSVSPLLNDCGKIIKITLENEVLLVDVIPNEDNTMTATVRERSGFELKFISNIEGSK